MAKNIPLLAKSKKRIENDNEIAARKNLIEELFYDFHRNRAQVYLTNFIRGIFFGLGSVLGGTIVIALLVWLLSLFGNFIPPLNNFFNDVTTTIQDSNQQ